MQKRFCIKEDWSDPIVEAPAIPEKIVKAKKQKQAKSRRKDRVGGRR